MPDPQTPSTIFGGQNTMTGGTNDAMPQFGGRANPGESVHVSVDGQEQTVTQDENGMWDYSSPELANGEHEFEMWSENEAGDRSDSVEWESDVSSGDADRASQRARNEQWEESGRDDWQEENSGLTPTPVSAGGGGGGQPPPGGSGSGGSGGGGRTPPVGGVEKGNQPGPVVMD